MHTFNDIIGKLKKRIYEPVYFLTGEEPYFIDEIASFIENNVLTDEEKEFNQHVVYGRDTDILTIVSLCRRYPIMASHVVVSIREAQELDSLNNFESYIEKPVPSTILVMSYKHKKLDGRMKIARLIKEKTAYFESKQLTDDKVATWIMQYLGEKNMYVTITSAQTLADHLGNELGVVVNELNKLLINLKPGSTITEDHIEKYIGISKNFNVFEFQKALGAKNVYRSFHIARYLAANPKENHILKIIPIIYQFFSKLLVYHQLTDKSDANAAKALGVNPYFLKDYRTAAQNYTPQKLYSIIRMLRKYDLRSKGLGNESTDTASLLNEMVFYILH